MTLGRYIAVLVALVIAQGAGADQDDFLRPIGKPPTARPQMRQGGEALPPLPLPATPLRRSEKKRPPSPATLIGKVVWGSFLDYQWPDGQLTRVFDWNMVPADCQQLLLTTQKHLNMEYKAETVSLDSFTATPAQIPVLYFSGGRSLNFSAGQRQTLRQYMLDGGMIWFDSVVGSPYFYKSALLELQQLLPESPVVRLPLDHPLFHMLEDTVVTATQTQQATPPVLDGVYIGSRVAAVVSPYGLGCGWDNARPALIAKANFYDRRSAVLLGLNLVAYAVGYFRVGQAYAQAEVFRQTDAEPNPDRIRFVQVRTNGVWNTEPGGPANLLRFLNKNLNISVSYRRDTVSLAKDSLADYPFLYLSGITDFALTMPERQALRDYLRQGGFLLIDNSLGLREFDLAVRRELAALLPDAPLQRLGADHPLFRQGPFPLTKVRYTLAATARHVGQDQPWLEGVELDRRLGIVYSPLDLAAGWQGDDHPLAYGYQSGDALQLGANLITYFLTH